jgi:hypothetical protein
MLELKLKLEEQQNLIKSATDFSDAIDKTFNFPSDIIILQFETGNLEIPLCYNLSELIEDILHILSDLKDNEKGNGLYGFSQNDSFDADWELNWMKNDLEIIFHWRLPDPNNSNLPNSIKVKKIDFIQMWVNALSKISTYFGKTHFDYTEEFEMIKRLES